jgi:acyl transferase domain-containing protein
LREGRGAIQEIPPSRWDVERFYDPDLAGPQTMNSRWAGLVDGIDELDAELFGISAREAAGMDPQQRMALEVAWEALEHAGIAPTGLARSAAGVFMGVSTLDYQSLHRYAPSRGGTGVSASIVANRVSYALDLRGPSVAIDAACSSSLVAVDAACLSLRGGGCDLALAGGVNAILSPQWGITFAQAGILAADGRCKAFDARADGFVRAEGCGIVALKRLGEALADGDRVLAVILGSAVNQDGRSSGLTAPSAEAQRALVRAALDRAGVSAGEVGVVECHATGTALGDATEVKALADVLAAGRGTGSTCWIGSVKTNIGHLEAAAGIAGLIKAVLILEHGAVPPHRELRQLNPALGLEETCLRVTTELRPWPRGGARRVAGVSSFGIGGTNAHVVLAEPPEAPALDRPAPVDVLPLSAWSPEALATLAGRYADAVGSGAPLDALRRTAAVGRAHMRARAAVVGATREELEAALRALAAGPGEGGARGGPPEGPARVGFLFTGQGAQWPGMGAELLDTAPAFAEAFRRCAAVLDPLIGGSLVELLRGRAELSDTGLAQPALFALEVSLAALWEAWGVRPAAVLGHSLGELAAAHVAGAVALGPACRLVAERARLMRALPAGGAMATEFAAFHSPLMDPVLDPFEEAAARVPFEAPRVPFIANLTGAREEALDAIYWRRQLREPVRFVDGLRALAALGCDALLEIGPAKGLIDLAKRTLSPPPALFHSLSREEPPARTLGAALGGLYARGAAIDWRAVHGPGGARIALPTYPFARRRHWLPDAEIRRFEP